MATWAHINGIDLMGDTVSRMKNRWSHAISPDLLVKHARDVEYRIAILLGEWGFTEPTYLETWLSGYLVYLDYEVLETATNPTRALQRHELSYSDLTLYYVAGVLYANRYLDTVVTRMLEEMNGSDSVQWNALKDGIRAP